MTSTYIFDASAIYALIGSKRFALFAEGFTLHLARYELGNILWKEVHIHKRMKLEEERMLSEIAEGVFENIEIHDIAGKIDAIFHLADKYSISFYDAAYVYLAKEKNAILVTDDEKLIKKIKDVINTAQPSGLL